MSYLFAAVLFLSAAAAQAAGRTAPLWTRGGHLYLPVEVVSAIGIFQLDTGGISYVEDDFAAKARVPYNVTYQSYITGELKIAGLWLTKDDSYSFAFVKDRRLAVRDAALKRDGVAADGRLGFMPLSQVSTLLWFSSGTMVVYPGSESLGPLAGAYSAELSSKALHLGYPAALLSFGPSVSAPFLLDTLERDSFVETALWKKLAPLIDHAEEGESTWRGIPCRRYTAGAFTADQARFGRVSFCVGEWRKDPLPYSGALGLDVLRAFSAVLVDTNAGRAGFFPSHRDALRFSPGASGRQPGLQVPAERKKGRGPLFY